MRIEYGLRVDRRHHVTTEPTVTATTIVVGLFTPATVVEIYALATYVNVRRVPSCPMWMDLDATEGSGVAQPCDVPTLDARTSTPQPSTIFLALYRATRIEADSCHIESRSANPHER
jgi:hypothetical protein